MRGDSESTLSDRRIVHRVDRRKVLKSAGVGAAALAAGCIGGGDGDDGGDGDGDGDGDDGETGSPAGGDIEGPVTLGALVPLPGQFPGGTAMKQASELFVKQLNDNGGLAGADVDLVVKDTKLDPATTRDKYRELMLEDEVDATFGLFGSEPGLAVFDQIPEFNKIHVAGGVATTEVNQRINDNYGDYKYWFRALPNGYHLGYNLAQVAAEEWETWGISDIAVVQEDITGFNPIVEAAVNNMPDFVNVVYEQKFSPDTNDFSPILNKGESEDIDLMFAFLSQGGISLEVQWAKEERNYLFGGADIFSAMPAQWKNTNGNVEYVWTYIPGAAPTATPNQTCADFIEAFRNEYGSPPPHSQAYTQYDALSSYAAAVEQAGTLDADELVNTLEGISYEGVTGQMDHYDEGETYVHDPVYGKDGVVPPIIQWQEVDGEGTQVGLWPEKVKSGEFKKPPWVSL